METKLADAERKGIEAIIFLQSMAGIKESEEQALKGWRGMDSYQKAETLRIYEIFHKED